MPEFDPYLTWLGIPPNQRPPTHYQLLGVDPAITDAAVIKALAIQRSAYVRNFQRTEHGDVCTRILEELARAEAILTDPPKRAEYDRSLKPLTPAPLPPPKAVPAKAIAVPAPRPPQPSPVRKPKRSEGNREALAAVKWTALAIVGVAMVIGAVSISRMFSGAAQASLAVTFEEPWPDATISVDDRRIESAAGGARVPLSPGEHLVAVSRGSLGTFRKNITLAPNAPAEVRVPSSAFQSSTTGSTVSMKGSNASNSLTAAVPAPKPLTIIFNPVPNDAEAVVSSGKATLIREPNTFRLATDSAAITAGVEITFSKKGFASKTVRVKPDDATVAAVSVRLASEARRTARLSVRPRDAEVTVKVGEAKKMDDGTWEVSAPVDMECITVFCLGFTTQKLAVASDGATMMVSLRGSPTGVWDYYRSLDKDAMLRLVGRAGSFGGSVRRLALSRNGKWLAVAEAGRPAIVHLWDVDKAEFVGPVFHNQDAPDKSETPKSQPVAVAVSNDGRYIALSCLVLSIFDVQQGKEIKRFGKDAADNSPADALGTAFSGDDAQLFTSLRDGRIVVRDTKTWDVVDTLKGLDVDATDVRFSADGAFATGVGKGGLFLWSKETGKKTVLEGRRSVVEPNRWSARPDDDHYVMLPGDPEREKFRDAIVGMDPELRIAYGKPQQRKYDAVAPRRVTINMDESHYAIESLTTGRAAVVQWRYQKDEFIRLGKEQGRNFSIPRTMATLGDWGLHIWDMTAGRSLGAVYFPSMVYAMTSSDDGRTLATVVDREHCVCLWKFNPKGEVPDRFSQRVEWDKPPLRRWDGRWPAVRDKHRLTELPNGDWEYVNADKTARFKERTRTPFEIVFAGSDAEHHFFNSGVHWERHAPDRDKSKHLRPDFQGDPQWAKALKRTPDWVRPSQGAWEDGGLPPRRADGLRQEAESRPGKAPDES